MGGELLNHVAVVLDDENLLAAIAAKCLGQGNRFNATVTATGAGVVGVLVNLLAFVGTHSTTEGGARWAVNHHHSDTLTKTSPEIQPTRAS